MVKVYPMLMNNQFHPMDLDKDDEELKESQIKMTMTTIELMNTN